MKFKFTLPVFLLVCSSAKAQYGLLDYSFDGDGLVTTSVGPDYNNGTKMVIQPDGKIIVVGSSVNSTDVDFAVVRYHPDGSLDNSFDGDGKVTTDIAGRNDYVMSVALQADGKIIVAGEASLNPADVAYTLVRYHTDGSIDSSFHHDGITTTLFTNCYSNRLKSIAIQPDGKIVAVGGSITPDSAVYSVARYLVNGDPDSSFNGNGMVTLSSTSTSLSFNAVFIQSDGKIVAGGNYTNPSAFYPIIKRLNADGSLDNSFVVGFPAGSHYLDALKQLPDGKFLVCGSTVSNAYIMRFDSNGIQDASFGSGGTTIVNVTPQPDHFNSLTVQPDGKIIASGFSYNGINSNFLVCRFSSNGITDPTFGSAGITVSDFGSNERSYSCALQADGKILLSGTIETDTNSMFALARYHGSTVSINETGQPEINVYPNPVSEQVQVNLPETLQHAALKLTNTSGQVVLEQLNVSGNHFVLDVSGISAGLYVLEISQDQQVMRTRLVKN